MSEVGFDEIYAIHSHACRTLKPSSNELERLFGDCIINTYATRGCPEQTSVGLTPSTAMH